MVNQLSLEISDKCVTLLQTMSRRRMEITLPYEIGLHFTLRYHGNLTLLHMDT